MERTEAVVCHNKLCYKLTSLFVVMSSADDFDFFTSLALSNLVTTDELLLLMTAHTADVLQQDKHHEAYDKFDIDNFNESQCKSLFRFGKDDLIELSSLIALPHQYIGHIGIVWTPLEGTCMLLRRLCYPGRLVDLAPYFGHSAPDCSIIVNNILADVHHCFSYLLSSIDQLWMDHEHYCAAVQDKGAPVNNVFGFVDGTLRQICRPGHRQKEMFSGHKRHHDLKFQHVMLPNGLVCHSYGLYPSCRHDTSMYGVSGVDAQLSKLVGVDGRQLVIFGDAAYPVQLWLFAPFPEHAASFDAQKALFNTSMSPIRSAVEWGFGKLTTYFAFNNFYTNLKLHLQPLGHYFQVATLLANCHTCYYGSQVTSFFDLPPLPLTCTSTEECHVHVDSQLLSLLLQCRKQTESVVRFQNFILNLLSLEHNCK